MHRNAVLLLMSCAALSGCDFVYGVERDASIGFEPPQECVERVIRGVPGIAEVKYSAAQTGKGLFHPEPWIYYYSYSGTPESHIIGTLQIYKEYDGSLRYHDTLLGLNMKPAQIEIDATRVAMLTMENELASQCGVVSLPSQVKETCIGVQCKPM